MQTAESFRLRRPNQLLHHPVADGSSLGRERAGDGIDRAAVVGVGLGITTVDDLCHALSGRMVEVVLEDVDIARCLYHAVGAAFRCRLLVVCILLPC